MAQSLSNLALGTKVKFGRHSINGEVAREIIWVVAAKSHLGYPANSVTLWADKSVDLRSFDAKESGTNTTEQYNGNGAYNVSNLGQWLNSDAEASMWYSAAHGYDNPPSIDNVTSGTAYDNRPGFLNLFTTREKNAILPTTIYTKAPPGGNNGGTITQKVFLPSSKELGDSNGVTDEGNTWGYNNYTTPYVTQQVLSYSLSADKPASMSDQWRYWTRTSLGTGSVVIVNVGINFTTFPAINGAVGVRPVINLSNALSVSDTTDSDGCYTFMWNAAPPEPATLNVPTTIYGGKSNPISWTKVTDPDGDTVTYLLECSVNGGSYTQIYNGTALSYAHLVPFGTSSVTYRVKAVDPPGESSTYVTSTTKTVVNNNAPVISGSDANLGVKSSGFTGTYTVTDANNNAVTVTEAIDGVRIRSLVATLGQAITYGVTENTWLALPNGSHTLTISATDGIDTSVRTYAFTKLVDSFKIQNTAPWSTGGARPTRIMIVVTRNIPAAATFKVEVCNNGYDASPTWEDATDAVKSGLVHVFANNTKTGANWGVLVRVTVERNGATGACYVSAIGGNFE